MARGRSMAEIRFLLNDQEVRLDAVDPERTVLAWLREERRLTGTKEGCAEGDCGACTIAVGGLEKGRLVYRAINACIAFLPVLDGKHLVTVEGLAGDGGLHPVQRALVDLHGSQCGFCTPGFVMSLYVLARTETARPTRQAVNDAIAGNLCRCTGYRPIVDAAMAALPVAPDGPAEAAVIAKLKRLKRRGTLALESGAKRFFAPVGADAAADLVLKHKQARLLAGGTDLALEVTKAHRDLGTVIYLGDVAEFHRIQRSADALTFGAAVSYSAAEAALAAAYADFGEVVRRLGSRQIRNAGTLAGNIANASPIGDIPPLGLALGAAVQLRRGARRRTVPLDRFFTGYRQTALKPGEFIEAVRVPLPVPGAVFRAYKIAKRFDQDISAVCAAFWLRLDGGRVRAARLAFGGVAATPVRAAEAEAALIGRAWTAPVAEDAAQALVQDIDPISDLRASRDYRLLVAQNLIRKFHLETSGAPGALRVVGFDG